MVLLYYLFLTLCTNYVWTAKSGLAADYNEIKKSKTIILSHQDQVANAFIRKLESDKRDKKIEGEVYSSELCSESDERLEEICNRCLQIPYLTFYNHIYFDQNRNKYLENRCIWKTVRLLGQRSAKRRRRRRRNRGGTLPYSQLRFIKQQVIKCPILEKNENHEIISRESYLYISNGLYTNDYNLSCFIFADINYIFPTERILSKRFLKFKPDDKTDDDVIVAFHVTDKNHDYDVEDDPLDEPKTLKKLPKYIDNSLDEPKTLKKLPKYDDSKEITHLDKREKLSDNSAESIKSDKSGESRIDKDLKEEPDDAAENHEEKERSGESNKSNESENGDHRKKIINRDDGEELHQSENSKNLIAKSRDLMGSLSNVFNKKSPENPHTHSEQEPKINPSENPKDSFVKSLDPLLNLFRKKRDETPHSNSEHDPHSSESNYETAAENETSHEEENKKPKNGLHEKHPDSVEIHKNPSEEKKVDQSLPRKESNEIHAESNGGQKNSSEEDKDDEKHNKSIESKSDTDKGRKNSSEEDKSDEKHNKSIESKSDTDKGRKNSSEEDKSDEKHNKSHESKSDTYEGRKNSSEEDKSDEKHNKSHESKSGTGEGRKNSSEEDKSDEKHNKSHESKSDTAPPPKDNTETHNTSTESNGGRKNSAEDKSDEKHNMPTENPSPKESNKIHESLEEHRESKKDSSEDERSNEKHNMPNVLEKDIAKNLPQNEIPVQITKGDQKDSSEESDKKRRAYHKGNEVPETSQLKNETSPNNNEPADKKIENPIEKLLERVKSMNLSDFEHANLKTDDAKRMEEEAKEAFLKKINESKEHGTNREIEIADEQFCQINDISDYDKICGGCINSSETMRSLNLVYDESRKNQVSHKCIFKNIRVYKPASNKTRVFRKIRSFSRTRDPEKLQNEIMIQPVSYRQAVLACPVKKRLLPNDGKAGWRHSKINENIIYYVANGLDTNSKIHHGQSCFILKDSKNEIAIISYVKDQIRSLNNLLSRGIKKVKSRSPRDRTSHQNTDPNLVKLHSNLKNPIEAGVVIQNLTKLPSNKNQNSLENVQRSSNLLHPRINSLNLKPKLQKMRSAVENEGLKLKGPIKEKFNDIYKRSKSLRDNGIGNLEMMKNDFKKFRDNNLKDSNESNNRSSGGIENFEAMKKDLINLRNKNVKNLTVDEKSSDESAKNYSPVFKRIAESKLKRNHRNRNVDVDDIKRLLSEKNRQTQENELIENPVRLENHEKEQEKSSQNSPTNYEDKILSAADYYYPKKRLRNLPAQNNVPQKRRLPRRRVQPQIIQNDVPPVEKSDDQAKLKIKTDSSSENMKNEEPKKFKDSNIKLDNISKRIEKAGDTIKKLENGILKDKQFSSKLGDIAKTLEDIRANSEVIKSVKSEEEHH